MPGGSSSKTRGSLAAFVLRFRVNLLHDLLEDVYWRLVFAQERQSAAELFVTVQ